jgi:ribokinase
VVVVGSSNTDLVIRGERLPSPGETIQGGRLETHSGGKGANQAVAAARMGARVTFLACIGQDDFGGAARRHLQAQGIQIRDAGHPGSLPSGVALILVDRKGQNLISVAHGSNQALSAAGVREAADVFADAAIVLSQQEVPVDAVLQAARLASEMGIPFVLNPAPAIRPPAELLRRTTIITPNESELGVLTVTRIRTRAQLVRAARRLQSRGPRDVIVTLGPRGVVHLNAAGVVTHYPAPRVKAVDATGAGDCFSGALAAFLASDHTVAEAIPLAVQAASLSVMRAGAQAGMPWYRELSPDAVGKRSPHAAVSRPGTRRPRL